MLNKTISIFLLTIIAAAAFMTAAANSGPVYMPGDPSFEILPLENCPIEVESEKLSFDISDDMYGWSPIANVTAAYQMKNPTEQAQTIKMAFPFIFSPHRNALEETAVKADGEALPYSVLLARELTGTDYADNPELFYEAADMRNILDGINAAPYVPQAFDEEASAALYTFTAGDKYSDLNVVLTFSMDTEKSSIIINGFNGYSVSGGNIELSVWFRAQASNREPITLFVLGEDTLQNLQITAYADGYKQGEVKDAGVSYEKSAVTAAEYISQYMLTDELRQSYWANVIPSSYIYELTCRRLDKTFGDGQPVIYMGDAQSAFLSGSFMAVLLYDVEFPPNSVREVSVSYAMGGTLDRRESSDYTYTYAYILNPARGYADFGKLDVEINPPSENPYITSSSLPLELGPDGVYRASYNELPDSDLVFTLYNQPEITFTEKASRAFWRHIGYYSPFIIAMILLIVIAVPTALILRRRRKRRR